MGAAAPACRRPPSTTYSHINDTASWADGEWNAVDGTAAFCVEHKPLSLPPARIAASVKQPRARYFTVAGCLRIPTLSKEGADSAKAARRPPKGSRAANSELPKTCKEAQDASPRKWEPRTAASFSEQRSSPDEVTKSKQAKQSKSVAGSAESQSSRSSKSSKTALSSKAAYTEQHSLVTEKVSAQPDSSKADLAMHDSMSSLQYVASFDKQEMADASAAQLEGIRRANAEFTGLQPEWLIDPAAIFFCAKTSGKLCRLGRGTYGTVYQGMWNGEMVAVKVCRKAHVTDKAMETFVKEVAILHGYQNDGLVQFKGACCWKHGRRTVLVTEYMPNGDLFTALGRSPHRYSWYALGRGIALDVACGLAFLHTNNIVHFDLKSANILLDKDNRAKLADLGLAKLLTQGHGSDSLCTFMSTGDIGTFAWAAPEALMGETCDHKADIWSFGVLIWELCTTEMPQSRCLRPLRVPEECSRAISDLMLSCLDPNPDRRPTADELVILLSSLV